MNVLDGFTVRAVSKGAGWGGCFPDDLSCCRFRPVGPRLSSTTQGLELSDVYALTIIEDAGLEMHQVELLLESRK